jgi:hypothetical protein
MPKTPATLTDADIAFTNEMAKAMRFVRAVAPDYATNVFINAMQDMRVSPALRRDNLVKFLFEYAKTDRNATAGKVLRIYRANNDDFGAKALGWSIFMNNRGGGDIRRMADAFASRGAWEDVATLFDTWTDWDGKMLPVGLRLGRQREKMNRLRGAAAKSPAAKALYDKHLPAYFRLLEDCAKNGATAEDRGDARLDLLSLRRDTLDAEARAAALRAIYTDKFMQNKTRARAVSMAPAICTYDGETDWNQVKALAAEAVASGDWSGMYPHFYSRNRKSDTRIHTIVALAKKAAESDRKDIAKDLLENCASTLGYFEGATPADLGDNNQAEFEMRLSVLTNAMNTCGATLPKKQR